MSKLVKSDAEWHAVLSPAQFSVLRKGQDEPKGSHPLVTETGRRDYICAGCFNPLFESGAKFASKDYPSFYEANPNSVDIVPGAGPSGNFYRCARCGGHQGQVYNDGPRPTGKRYANNGEAILFVPRGKPLPPLRT